MLNPFPIQFLALFAYAVLRIIVGLVLIYLGTKHLRNRDALVPSFSFRFFPYGRFSVWYLVFVEIVLGLMFTFGLLTQIAALITMVLSLKLIVLQRRLASPFIPGRLFYVLLFGISFSLFITGAGIFAFDVPL